MVGRGLSTVSGGRRWLCSEAAVLRWCWEGEVGPSRIYAGWGRPWDTWIGEIGGGEMVSTRGGATGARRQEWLWAVGSGRFR